MSIERTELILGGPCYPSQLALSPDPPKRLYVLGDVSALEPGVAIVGARKATPYGLQAAAIFAGWAARSGYVVISGGAVGCDQAAHRAALDNGGRTVAVMAGGADVAYPRASGPLLAEVARHGCVVSEHPWGSEPRRWCFRTRNRIIAWLANALLVVEAGLPSGTFSTADYMVEAGRDVLAVPGSIFSQESRGPNRLLSQGATPVSDVTEFAYALESALGPPPSHRVGQDLVQHDRNDDVLRAIRACAQRPDDLARDLELDILEVARRIGTLEIAGLVVRYRDGRYGPRLAAGREEPGAMT